MLICPRCWSILGKDMAAASNWGEGSLVSPPAPNWGVSLVTLFLFCPGVCLSFYTLVPPVSGSEVWWTELGARSQAHASSNPSADTNSRCGPLVSLCLYFLILKMGIIIRAGWEIMMTLSCILLGRVSELP